MENNPNFKGGFCVALDDETPTVIEVDGKIIQLFKFVTTSGNVRCRIVADRDIKITGPHRIKKNSNDEITRNLIANHPELVSNTRE